MKKIVKRLTVALIVAMMAVIMLPFSAAAEDTYTVYADVPDSWGNPNIWAWTDGGANVYATWPGEAMDEADDGLFSKEIPVSATNVIINAAGATPQTTDLKVTGEDCKITVNDDGSVSIEYLEETETPEETEEPTTKEEVQTTTAEQTTTQAPDSTTSSLGPEVVVIIIAIVVVVIIVAAIIFVVFKKQ